MSAGDRLFKQALIAALLLAFVLVAVGLVATLLHFLGEQWVLGMVGVVMLLIGLWLAAGMVVETMERRTKR